MINDDAFQRLINRIKEQHFHVESLFMTQNNREYSYVFQNIGLKDIRSVSKMVTGFALGVAMAKGYFKDGINTYIYPYFKDEKITNKKNLEQLQALQIKHLISYTAGYDSQLLNKAHLKTIPNVTNYANYALNYSFRYKPGEKFVFCNAPIYLLSIILEKETGKKLADFVREEMMQKLDIIDFEWDESIEGHTWGATGLKLYPHDLHKIGKLLLHDGVYHNNQIVPKDWIKEMKTLKNLSPHDYVMGRVLPKYGHGYTLWLCENDICFHDGKDGQYVICVPSKKMLITITASDEEHRHDILELLREFILGK